MKWFGKKKNAETGPDVTGTTESVTVDNSGVKYIENPLPLPKKHVNKTMDFDIEISENDDFDV